MCPLVCIQYSRILKRETVEARIAESDQRPAELRDRKDIREKAMEKALWLWGQQMCRGQDMQRDEGMCLETEAEGQRKQGQVPDKGCHQVLEEGGSQELQIAKGP